MHSEKKLDYKKKNDDFLLKSKLFCNVLAHIILGSKWRLIEHKILHVLSKFEKQEKYHARKMN